MSNILTAEEFVNQYDWENSTLDIPSVLIEFAKLHVESALKAASENVITDYNVIDLAEECIEVYVITSSILDAYHLSNIK